MQPFSEAVVGLLNAITGGTTLATVRERAF